MTPDVRTVALPHRVLVGSAILIWSIGMLIQNILPVILQALAQDHGLNEEQLGAVGAVFVVGSGVTIGSGPLWIRASNWRQLSGWSLLITALLVAGVAALTGYIALLTAFLMLGLLTGLVQTPSFAVLGDTAEPARAFGAALFASLLLAAALSFTLPTLVAPRLGTTGLLAVIALLTLISVPAVRALPTRALPGPVVGTQSTRVSLWDDKRALAVAILATLAGAVYNAPVLAIYYMTAPIAAANGISEKIVGPLIGAGIVLSMVGALIPSFLGNRVRCLTMIGVSSLAIVALAFPAMTSRSALLFGAGYLLFIPSWGLGFTYLLAIARELDTTHRVYVAAPAAQAAGGALGSMVGGVVLARYGQVAFFELAAALLLVSFLVCLGASRLFVANAKGFTGAAASEPGRNPSIQPSEML